MQNGQGVRLTRSQYREALQQFAEREASQGFHPDVPKYLSNKAIQPTISDRYLGLDYYDWTSVSVNPDVGSSSITWSLRARLDEIFPDVDDFVTGSWRVGIVQNASNTFDLFFRSSPNLSYFSTNPGAIYYHEAFSNTSGNQHFTLGEGGYLPPGEDLAVIQSGDTDILETASYAEVVVKPLPFEIDSRPANYDLINRFTS